MQSVHMKSGSSSLRASGTVIPFENDEVRMSLEIPITDRSMFDIDVTFIFNQGTGKDKGFTIVNRLESMNPEDIGTSAQFEITIHNCDRAGVVSNEKPVLLGELSGSGLYLNFIAEGRERSAQKVLYYSFYTT